MASAGLKYSASFTGPAAPWLVFNCIFFGSNLGLFVTLSVCNCPVNLVCFMNIPTFLCNFNPRSMYPCASTMWKTNFQYQLFHLLQMTLIPYYYIRLPLQPFSVVLSSPYPPICLPCSLNSEVFTCWYVVSGMFWTLTLISYRWGQTEAHVCAELCKGLGQMMRVRWACIHVLIHVHLLTKVGPRAFIQSHTECTIIQLCTTMWMDCCRPEDSGGHACM